VSAVVLDASAGVEIVAETRRGRALARLVPAGSEGWVPEHFYAEVLGVLRRRFLIEAKLTGSQATASVARLGSWHLHRASVAPLVPAAWRYRHKRCPPSPGIGVRDRPEQVSGIVRIQCPEAAGLLTRR
jgi:predicted nucleic acid-binding protein